MIAPQIGPWENFYVITGSSAAALTGLMFVVITLVAGVERLRRQPDGISTFSTPNVVHFCTALFVSAVLSAPWHVLVHPAVLLGLTGLYGMVYVGRVMVRMRVHDYSPDIEDWSWYACLPFLAYAVLAVSATLLPRVPVETLFAVAGVTITLIFIGIHNAWDVVTFITINQLNEKSSTGNDSDRGNDADRSNDADRGNDARRGDTATRENLSS